MTQQTDVPAGLNRARHGELAGRAHHAWWRRAALAVVVAVPVLALSGVFGQHAAVVTYRGRAASLQVDSPGRLRGGLVFTTGIAIIPRRQLTDARLYLDNGWFRGMTFNGAIPQPSNQGAQGRWQVWDFGALRAGVAFHVWISWQVNPTNVGRHSQDVQLYDGGTRLVTARRVVTVFP